MKLKFEKIDSTYSRARVFGGGLVRAYEGTRTFALGVPLSDRSPAIALAFVSDPQHEWSVKDGEGAVKADWCCPAC